MEYTERDHAYAKLILDAGKDMLARHLTIETWGNISLRDPVTGRIYLTPSGMDYSTLQEEDVCILDADGKDLTNFRKPSVEKQMHIDIYHTRRDVYAIVHTHPLDSTVFAVLQKAIPVVTDEMAQAIGGEVHCAKYALPGTKELAHNVCAALGNVQACLLANHGALVVGKDIKECFKNAAVLETSANIYYHALAIGKPVIIDPENVTSMRDFALHRYGQK